MPSAWGSLERDGGAAHRKDIFGEGVGGMFDYEFVCGSVNSLTKLVEPSFFFSLSLSLSIHGNSFPCHYLPLKRFTRWQTPFYCQMKRGCQHSSLGGREFL